MAILTMAILTRYDTIAGIFMWLYLFSSSIILASLLTMTTLTMAMLTMAILTMATLTIAILTMAILTMALPLLLLDHPGQPAHRQP
eukprot:scaffold64836_cov33-Phaeocystis_antarctica.AAC.1